MKNFVFLCALAVCCSLAFVFGVNRGNTLNEEKLAIVEAENQAYRAAIIDYCWTVDTQQVLAKFPK